MSVTMLVPYKGENQLAGYMQQVDSYPMLSAEEEFELAVRYREQNDLEAAHKLVTSYLRYVASIAKEYQGYYGIKFMDLVQEGSVGLMQAVKRFDPHKGFRLATYAMWWIKASIQEFVLHHWSLVKIGTTAAQRKLFFNLRKSKDTLERLDATQAEEMGQRFGVSGEAVLEMDARLSGPDDSLNRCLVEGGEEIQNMLADSAPNQEMRLLASESERLQQQMIKQALSFLSEREQMIVRARIMCAEPVTLEVLGERLGVSRERIRQLETRALKKLRAFFEADGASLEDLMPA
ncbi:RNA polymerase, sigma 32 subunit, RpoH [Magnetococcus marinus MC-1]|uniref:RNA polymerase sigma factor RpoH n=1 Tax=Magnetococcus marinus (strain ATCC BAA-1437 / JCM 17883 / MC-1) TaxID=156889 RepID=A0LA30_MAGMM|nr:RNA polymerase sigma factor RpoH [Magnetococcus marinus]ABK44823.1 RNA polymerase, sigma 32 subunit, RpoH [Magnetococcus marinus MC-1]